jgi:hypothetical protein
MLTRVQFTKIALSMPEAVESSHFGQPDFRVRGKIFAGLDREAARASLKLPRELQSFLIASRPLAFVPAAGAWGQHGWTHVELEHVSAGELRDLLDEAWQLIAPAKLVARHQRGPATPATKGAADMVPEPGQRKRKKAQRKKKPSPSRASGTSGPTTSTDAPSRVRLRRPGS